MFGKLLLPLHVSIVAGAADRVGGLPELRCPWGQGVVGELACGGLGVRGRCQGGGPEFVEVWVTGSVWECRWWDFL